SANVSPPRPPFFGRVLGQLVRAESAPVSEQFFDRQGMKTVVSRAKAYLKVRHQNVRAAMKELKLDGLLLTHPPDLAYLTNFTGDDSVGLITEKDFFLATDFRYQEQADQEAGWLKQHIREAKMADTLAKMLAEAKVKRVGFEANFTTVGQID